MDISSQIPTRTRHPLPSITINAAPTMNRRNDSHAPAHLSRWCLNSMYLLATIGKILPQTLEPANLLDRSEDCLIDLRLQNLRRSVGESPWLSGSTRVPNGVVRISQELDDSSSAFDFFQLRAFPALLSVPTMAKSVEKFFLGCWVFRKLLNVLRYNG